MDFSRPDNARKINRLKVLGALRKESLSRAELSRELLINKVSISEITDSLLKEGLIEAGELDNNTSGRPATKLSIAKDKGRVLTFVFSSNVMASASNLAGTLLRYERFPLQTAEESIVSFISKMTTDGGRIYGATVIADNRDMVPEKLFPFPVLHTTRTLAAARAETEENSGLRKCLFLHWSDFIGAAYRFGLETTEIPTLAHMKVTKGVPCHCGGDGCLEAVASGRAIKEITGIQKYSTLLKDEKGQIAVYDVCKGMAFALSEAVQALGAETILLTGEMAAMNDDLYYSLQDMVSTALPPKRNVRLIKSKKSDNGVLEGAGIMALDQFFYHSQVLEEIQELQRKAADID